MFGFDIGSIVKGVTEGALAPLFGWLNKKQDTSLEKYKVDGQIDVSLVQADTERIRAQRDLAVASLAYRGDRWSRYLFAYPTGIWFIAYMVDSTFRPLFGWSYRVLTPEPFVLTWMGAVVSFLFLSSAITNFWRR